MTNVTYIDTNSRTVAMASAPDRIPAKGEWIILGDGDGVQTHYEVLQVTQQEFVQPSLQVLPNSTAVIVDVKRVIV